MRAIEPESSPAALAGDLRRLAEARLQAYMDQCRAFDLTPPSRAALPGDATRVWACSEFVANACIRDPAMLLDLLDRGDLTASYDGDGDSELGPGYHARIAPALDKVATEPELMECLRRVRRREMVRIAWRDIGGLDDFEDIVADTSALADAIVSCTLNTLDAWQQARLGTPVDEHGCAQRMLVLGLGKLGAEELNFSSDIDLIFAYPSRGDTRGGKRNTTNEEYFQRLGRSLIKVLSERTDEGRVFRVDMRLRPFGASGPLAMSFAALEQYYQTHGRDWERYALVRARVVAGDREGGCALLERLFPFVYRRYLDFGALESLRDMKRMITEETKRKGMADNVKLGTGGIREVEFTVQAFQMVRGGREPRLRQRRTLPVIAELGELRYLPEHAVDDLSRAYRFLRTLEHRLQQVADRQTHTLPEDVTGRGIVAAGMGLPDWTSLERVVKSHRMRVSSHFDQVLGPVDPGDGADNEGIRAAWATETDDEEGHAHMAAIGFEDADAVGAWDQVKHLRDAYNIRMMDERGRARLDRLMPDLLRAVAGQPDPVITLARVGRILETVARRSVYLALLCERRLALSQLVQLCRASPWIARRIERHPVLLDELLDPRSLYAPLDGAALMVELERRMDNVAAHDTEREMEVLRQFKHANTLRVAAADVARAIPLMVVSDHLTAIAEVSVREALGISTRDLDERFGEPYYESGGKRHRAPFAIIGYGKLGGIELGYGSDLDLVFIHGSTGEDQVTRGAKSVDNDLYFGRLAQRVIHFLSTRTADGVLFEVDPRLRPHGTSGVLVMSIDGLTHYLKEEAWTWEHQALVRARVVAGDRELRRLFESLRREVLLLERDPAELRDKIREMRARMRAELDRASPSTFDIKQGAGGVADIEFMVQYAALRWAHELGDYLGFTDNIRLLEGLGKLGLIAPQDVRLLTDAYRTYRARVHVQALQEDEGIVPEREYEPVRSAVRRVWAELMEK